MRKKNPRQRPNQKLRVRQMKHLRNCAKIGKSTKQSLDQLAAKLKEISK